MDSLFGIFKGYRRDNLNYIKEVVLNYMTVEHGWTITVYSRKLHDFIFWYDAFTKNPSIDLLLNYERDLRTKTGRKL